MSIITRASGTEDYQDPIIGWLRGLDLVIQVSMSMIWYRTALGTI